MTIRKGEEWGCSVQRPDRLVVAESDRALAALVASGQGNPLGVSGGDVFHSVGSPARRDPMQRLPMDLLHVEADGARHLAVAHVLVRRSWWRGEIVVVMNVDHLGEWNIAPRAHPNDGRFDVVEVAPSMSIRHRLQARRRLPQGTHVPHPDIRTRTGMEASWEFGRPQRLWIDGESIGSVRVLTVAVEPDAFAIHV